jgi:hypothetical protein
LCPKTPFCNRNAPWLRKHPSRRSSIVFDHLLASVPTITLATYGKKMVKCSALDTYLMKGGIKVRVWLDTPVLGSLAKGWTPEERSTFLEYVSLFWDKCIEKWLCVYVPRKSNTKLGDRYWFPPGANGKPLRSSNDLLLCLLFLKEEKATENTISSIIHNFDAKTTLIRFSLYIKDNILIKRERKV